MSFRNIRALEHAGPMSTTPRIVEQLLPTSLILSFALEKVPVDAQTEAVNKKCRPYRGGMMCDTCFSSVRVTAVCRRGSSLSLLAVYTTRHFNFRSISTLLLANATSSMPLENEVVFQTISPVRPKPFGLEAPPLPRHALYSQHPRHE